MTAATMIPERSHVRVARLIPILALLASFGPLATDMYLSAFPDMQTDLATDSRGISASLSVFLLGLALGQLIYGPVSDRFGRRSPLLIGTSLFVVSSALCLLSHDIISFLALRVLQALGGCCGIILGRAIVRDLYEEKDIARAFSALSMIGMAAPIVAPSLGVAILLIGGWRAIFVALVAVGLASLAAIWFGLPETLPPARRQRRISPAIIFGNFAGLLTQRRFLLTALMAGAAAGALFSFITGSSPAFITHFGVSRIAYAAIFSAVVLAMIAGGQCNRLALRRHPPATILRFALTANILAGAALVLAAAGPIPFVLAALLCAVGSVGAILPNSAALAIAASRDHAGSASSILGVLQFGGGFLASSLLAMTQNGSVYPMAIAILSCGIVGRVAIELFIREAPEGRSIP